MSERDKEANKLIGSFKLGRRYRGLGWETTKDLAHTIMRMKEIEAHLNKPAPAQSREEEAQIIEEYADYLYTLAGASVSSETDAKRKRFQSALAALRSRQSPQAEDDATTCLACGQHNTAPGYVCPACGRPYLDHEHVADKLLEAAAPQPSPQGEDAVAVSYPNPRELAVAFMSVMQSHTIRNGKVWEPVEQITAMLEHEFRRRDDALRARIASAQSSAQGEGAREMRAIVVKVDAWFTEYNTHWRTYGVAERLDLLNRMVAIQDDARAALERKETE